MNETPKTDEFAEITNIIISVREYRKKVEGAKACFCESILYALSGLRALIAREE